MSVFDTRYEERQRFLSSSPLCVYPHCYHPERASGSIPVGKVNHIILVLFLYCIDNSNNTFGPAQLYKFTVTTPRKEYDLNATRMLRYREK